MSNFDFLHAKFPELADDGRKAEKYLYLDNEVCMFFISRIFDNAVKYICSFNNVQNDGTKLAEPINELFAKHAVDEGIYWLLKMMRNFRNGNAHNKDYSLNESMILLQMSHILCEWLMENYGDGNYKRSGFIMPQSEQPAPSPAPTPQPQTQQKVPAMPAMSDAEFIKLCIKGTPKQIRTAITNGANVNAKGAQGRTALMNAVIQNPNPQVVDVLIDSGANVNAKNNKGMKALQFVHHNKKLRDTNTHKRLEKLTQN